MKCEFCDRECSSYESPREVETDRFMCEVNVCKYHLGVITRSENRGKWPKDYYEKFFELWVDRGVSNGR